MDESSAMWFLYSIVFSQVLISISHMYICYSFQHTIQTYHYMLLVWPHLSRMASGGLGAGRSNVCGLCPTVHQEGDRIEISGDV
jgi:hypothetical protein